MDSAARDVARDLRVDLIRFAALVSMYLAHTAPVHTVTKPVAFTNNLTATLFAVLVGMGLQLSWQHRRSVLSFAVGALVRGAVLVALGAWLDDVRSPIVVVLAFLGVLTWVAAVLPALGSRVLAALAVVVAVISPMVQDALRPMWLEQRLALNETRAWMLELLFTGSYYRALTFVAWAVIGMLCVRHLMDAERSRLLLIAAGSTGVAGAMYVGTKLVGVQIGAYDGRTWSIVFNALLALAVVALGLAVGPLLPRAVARLLAVTGAMTLTLYVAQIWFVHWSVTSFRPGPTHHSMFNLTVLVVGSIVFAGVWFALVRKQPWRRGPIEGVVDFVVRLLGRRPLAG